MPANSIRPFPHRFLLIITGLAAVLTFVIILLSAYIRLAESGLGCSPWPECYAHFSSDPQMQSPLGQLQGDHFGVRLMHRVTASVIALLVLMIVAIGFRYRDADGAGIRLPVAILIVIVLLTLLGINTPTRELPLIAFGNLVGGYVLLALLFWLGLRLMHEKTTAIGVGSVTAAPSRLALLAVSLQIASGGWASANYSTAACSGILHCNQVDSSQLISGFNPLRQLPIAEGILLDGSASSIMLVHQVAAVFLSLVVTVCLVPMLRQATELRTNLLVILFLLIATFSLGGMGTVLEMPLWSGMLHNLLSILFLLATGRLTYLIHAGLRPL